MPVNLGMSYIIRGPCGAYTHTSSGRVQSAVEGQCVTWGSVLNCCELKGEQCGSDCWRSGWLSLFYCLCFHVQPFLSPPQSTLGYCALAMATVHTLLFGWNRAFDPGQYHFYLPPTFTLVLILPLTVLLGRLVLLVPCMSSQLRKIRRGWEKTRHIRFTMPEAVSHVWEQQRRGSQHSKCCVVGGSSQSQLKKYRRGLLNEIVKTIFARRIIFNLFWNHISSWFYVWLAISNEQT